jgi:hypothetical protein
MEGKGKQTQPADAFRADPRIRELVRFLARRAAEADYAQLIEASRAMRHNPNETEES